MYDIVPLIDIDHEPRVDSRLIAEQLGVEHESFRKLIYQYQADFEEFGILRFEIGEIKGRGQPEKFAFLNEDQSYLGLTYVQNTEQARSLKKRLVRSFGEYRRWNAQTAFPVVRQGEQPATATLSAATLGALRQLKTDLKITGETGVVACPDRPSPLDCVALLDAVLDDIFQWRYPHPFAYGFDIAGKGYFVIRVTDVVYHSRKATHFKDFFECMTSKAHARIERELTESGLLFPMKRGPVIDGARLNWGVNLVDLKAKRRMMEAIQS